MKDEDYSMNEEQQRRAEEVFESFKKSKCSDSDFKKTMDNEEAIKDKSAKGALKKFAEDIGVYFEMLKDTFSGKYKNLPVGTIAAIVGSLLYVFSPIDIIPDFIPGLGLVDDAGVIAMCLNFTKMDIEKYLDYKKKNKED